MVDPLGAAVIGSAILSPYVVAVYLRLTENKEPKRERETTEDAVYYIFNREGR